THSNDSFDPGLFFCSPHERNGRLTLYFASIRLSSCSWASTMLRIAVAAFLTLGACAAAQEFKPYPQARVTEVQWQTYFDEVQTKLAATREEPPGQGIVVFQDQPNARTYVFTLPGHKAHPAWTTRQLELRGSDVFLGRIGYFAGDEPSFAEWYRSFVS